MHRTFNETSPRGSRGEVQPFSSLRWSPTATIQLSEMESKLYPEAEVILTKKNLKNIVDCLRGNSSVSNGFQSEVTEARLSQIRTYKFRRKAAGRLTCWLLAPCKMVGKNRGIQRWNFTEMFLMSKTSLASWRSFIEIQNTLPATFQNIQRK